MKIIATIGLIVIGAVVTYVQSRTGGGTTPGSSNAPSAVPAPTSPAQGVSTSANAVPDTTTAKPKPAASTPAMASAIAPTESRIASWNIEWLGKPEDRSGPAQGVAQDPKEVAEYIASSKAAIVGVCEIVTNVAGRPIRSREIESAIAELDKRTGSKWAYALNPGRSEGDQLTGVLWDTKQVTAQMPKGTPFNPDADVPWAVPVKKGRSSQGSGLWNRPPHAMKFSFGDGRTDVVMIVVHMKADYQGDFAAHRSEEARALVDALPAVKQAFGDQDIIIIGDTNCVGEREPAMQAFEAAGLRDLNSSGKQTHWRGGSMDRAMVPANQPEFAGSAMSVGSDEFLRTKRWEPREFKRRLSDHYLVVSTVKVMGDDD
ncbi:MAG: hypothetical protein K2W85_05015 [Phycisphaerales bacterium]|nr:hypothetical protein [Phycisphaerales bacterium]